jgi:NAD binding domain of 6-phosphogluconate dehydrogenase
MDPAACRRLAARLESAGRLYLDAPIRGGAARAADGTLTVLASGPRAAFAKARPALDAMAAKVHDLGAEVGLGSAFKMINQLLAGVHVAAAGESACRKTGPRPAQGLRGHYWVGWQFLDVRKPHPPCARRRLLAAKRSRFLREGPWHRPGHGATVEISSAAGCGGAAGHQERGWAAMTTPRLPASMRA